MAELLLARLRDRDWRLSAQRRAVAEVFVGEHVHLTPEQVHDLAQERLPEISRATVYNTLNELVAMGELRLVEVAEGPKRYDPNVTEAPRSPRLRGVPGHPRRAAHGAASDHHGGRPRRVPRDRHRGHLPRPLPRLRSSSPGLASPASRTTATGSSRIGFNHSSAAGSSSADSPAVEIHRASTRRNSGASRASQPTPSHRRLAHRGMP